MKRVQEECRPLFASKYREKTLRSRNKRKCKRKKSTRTVKRLCVVKDTAQVGQESEHHLDAPPQVSARNTIIRLKHTQNVWIRTYQRMVKWHSKHQTNYWKQCATQLKVENERLKRRMCAQPSYDSEETDGSDSDEDYRDEDDPFDDTEDEGEDERRAIEGSGDRRGRRPRGRTAEYDQSEDPELDEEFIAFMEVSARHRLEHRRLKNESVH